MDASKAQELAETNKCPPLVIYNMKACCDQSVAMVEEDEEEEEQEEEIGDHMASAATDVVV